MASGDSDVLSRFRNPHAVKKITFWCGDGPFGSPLSADLAGLGVVPPAALCTIINVNQVTLVLLWAHAGGHAHIIAADSMDVIRRLQLCTFGDAVQVCEASGRDVVFCESVGAEI